MWCRVGREVKKGSFVIKQDDKGKIAAVKCIKEVMFGELALLLSETGRTNR